ncbi:MAG TPA: hypothetical protein VEU51_17560 [Candidatus Acidoferrales bacterium]|nr:hypothetical protein [Candidatus Acidoferrales bacterium]
MRYGTTITLVASLIFEVSAATYASVAIGSMISIGGKRPPLSGTSRWSLTQIES